MRQDCVLPEVRLVEADAHHEARLCVPVWPVAFVAGLGEVLQDLFAGSEEVAEGQHEQRLVVSGMVQRGLLSSRDDDQ